MSLEELQLLLVRPQDLVVTAVRLVGFRADGDSVTAESGAQLELTLPPQSTGELLFDAGTGLAGAALGGTSRLSFSVDPGTTAPLSVEGILGLAAGGQPVPGETSVELPWRLAFRPKANAEGDALRSTVPTAPLPGEGGATGVWHVRLEAASGLGLVPLEGDAGDVGSAGEPFEPPLTRTLRDQIRANGQAPPPQGGPPTAPYLDLSPLGGTMSAKGTWPDFAWQQEVALGRDMLVKTESKGFLYPWGHRAILIEATRRTLLPDNGPATAGLEQVRILTIPDPVRTRSEDGVLARQLPFDEVEVLQTTIELDTVDEVPPGGIQQRSPRRLDELDTQQAQQQQALADQEAAVAALPQQRIDLINAAADADEGPIVAEQADIGPKIDELVAIDQAFQDFVHSHPPPPPDTSPATMKTEDEPGTVPEETVVVEDPGPPALTPDQAAELGRLQARAVELEAQREAIEARRQQDLALSVTEDDLAAFSAEFGDVIAKVRQLRVDVPNFVAFVAGIHELANQQLTVFSWPLAKSHERVLVPIRCDGLQMTTPVLFVQEQHFAASDDFDEFAPLNDSTVQNDLRNAWLANDARRLGVPGLSVDLVRSGAPQPSDVLPVQELTIGGNQDGLDFRAIIEEAKVVLKAVAELVPNSDGVAKIAFHPDYVRTGKADQVALKFGEQLGVDFSQAADKAGGLISPNFQVDVLSRVHGAVNSQALPGFLPDPPDLATAFKDTTILSIPLASIVDNVNLPKPLAIVTEPDGSVKMSWSDLTLKSHGPFVVEPGATFALSVVRSPAETETSCTIENFKLVLPPGGDLVQLHFKRLKFVQRPGHPPDLDVDGFKFELGGDLGLLKTLQEKIDLGSAAPTVRATPNGIHAAYSIGAPEVTAGMFVMRNIAASVGVDVPFDGKPIVSTLAFASRESPFGLSVSVFGGTGYLVFEIEGDRIRKLEASLDFGASVAISVGVAKAEVHALGGVRFVVSDGMVKATGFLRIGGSVDVLGLVSVSVELRVELAYDGQVLSGRATAVIEIDVTFWSGSIHLDSGEYVFAGAAAVGPPPAAAIETHKPSLDDWKKYRSKFQHAGA
jgi:hypothetical protein